MSFDVASVKLSKIPAVIVNGAPPRLPTFSFGPDDAKPSGGRFYARFPLGVFIRFAYKLALFQMADALANAPNWVRTDIFEIEAEAQGNSRPRADTSQGRQTGPKLLFSGAAVSGG